MIVYKLEKFWAKIWAKNNLGEVVGPDGEVLAPDGEILDTGL